MEGHSRATAYVVEQFDEEVEAFTGKFLEGGAS
jgi:hypothetical protein